MTFEVNKVYQGNALAVLRSWPEKVISCCMSSPPYWAKFITYGGDYNDMPERNEKGQFQKGQRYSTPTEFKKGQHWRPKKHQYITLQKSSSKIADLLNLMEASNTISIIEYHSKSEN